MNHTFISRRHNHTGHNLKFANNTCVNVSQTIFKKIEQIHVGSEATNIYGYLLAGYVP